jgi:hypothetical protein
MPRAAKPFDILPVLERYEADELPPRHRLMLLVLADAQERAWPEAAMMEKRTGMSAPALKAVQADLRSAGWFHAGPIVRLRAGGAVPRSKTENGEGSAVSSPPTHPPLEPSSAPPVSMGAPLGAAPSSAPKPPRYTSPGGRERAPTIPSRSPTTLGALLAERAGDDLLLVLSRGADEGNAWCKTTVEHVLERGGVITPNERKRLAQMRDEPRRPRGTSSLQSAGTWKPKGTLA